MRENASPKIKINTLTPGIPCFTLIPRKEASKMKEYLGDSVYAEVVEGHLVLTTNNGSGPSNKIMLNREVLHSLGGYLETYSGLVTA